MELLTISGSPIGGTPIGDPPTVGETPTHLGNPRDKEETTTTVVTALRQVFGHADDDAARLIIAGCLAAPDLTDEEIVFFIHQARSLDRPEVPHDPPGLGLTHAQHLFEGRAVDPLALDPLQVLDGLLDIVQILGGAGHD